MRRASASARRPPRRVGATPTASGAFSVRDSRRREVSKYLRPQRRVSLSSGGLAAQREARKRRPRAGRRTPLSARSQMDTREPHELAVPQCVSYPGGLPRTGLCRAERCAEGSRSAGEFSEAPKIESSVVEVADSPLPRTALRRFFSTQRSPQRAPLAPAASAWFQPLPRARAARYSPRLPQPARRSPAGRPRVLPAPRGRGRSSARLARAPAPLAAASTAFRGAAAQRFFDGQFAAGHPFESPLRRSRPLHRSNKHQRPACACDALRRPRARSSSC
jgi:hypothetical protein